MLPRLVTICECLLVLTLCAALVFGRSIAGPEAVRDREQRADEAVADLLRSTRSRTHMPRLRRNALAGTGAPLAGYTNGATGGLVTGNGDQWGEFYKPGHCRNNVKILNVCFKCGRETDSMKFYTRCCNRVGEYLEFCADLLQLPVDR